MFLRIGPLAALATAGWLAIAAPASAQIALPSTLPSLPQDLTDRLGASGPVRDLTRSTLQEVLEAPERLGRLVQRSRGALQTDPQGWPIVANEVVALDLSPQAQSQALAAGFTIIRQERLEALDLTIVVLRPPRRLSTERAVEALRQISPETEVTFNHVATPADALEPAPLGAAEPARSTQRSSSGSTGALGLIDTGVEATHPALASSTIEQRGFSGPARMGAHGTAVASLMVGRHGPLQGGDPGAALLVADIYGGKADGGSAVALASALSWLVERRVTVINISLVGPRNSLIERAVAAAQARGAVLVAAVGNDGPSAPPFFPASYPGVIGVTAVNAQGRVLPEAGRGDQVDFAAPGADMAAAGQAGRFVSVRGTSFAAPLVAGLIARSGLSALHPAPAGQAGRDPIYGQGLVAQDLRTPPQAVGARGRLSS